MIPFLAHAYFICVDYIKSINNKLFIQCHPQFRLSNSIIYQTAHFSLRSPIPSRFFSQRTNRIFRAECLHIVSSCQCVHLSNYKEVCQLIAKWNPVFSLHAASAIIFRPAISLVCSSRFYFMADAALEIEKWYSLRPFDREENSLPFFCPFVNF